MYRDKALFCARKAALIGVCTVLTSFNVAAAAAPDFEHTRYRLVLNGLSFHYDTKTPRQKLRETNGGLGLEARWPAGMFAVASSYIDSYDGDAWLAGVGKRWPWWHSANGGVYVAAGLVAGVTYRRLQFGNSDRDLTGGVLPLLTVGAGPFEANVSVLPKIPDLIDDPAVALNFSVQLN